MKTPRSTPQEERLGLLIVVLLVLGVLITLLPSRARSDLPVPGLAGPPLVDKRAAAADRVATGHVPIRAPAYVEAAGRGSEGRIVRIPPRPGRDRHVRVLARFMRRDI